MKFEISNYDSGEYTLCSGRITTLFEITWDNNPMRHAVAQLAEALRYKSEGHGFNSWWCHWIFSLT
jgi:hypothetical protein